MSLPYGIHSRKTDAQLKWVGVMEAYTHLNLKASTLIDIGCSIGPLSYYFKEIVETVYGIDSDLALNFNDKKNSGITIIQEDFLTINTIQSGSIDVVIDSCAIGCSMNIPPVIEKISNLLKPGGYLITVGDTDLNKETLPFINPKTWIELCKKSNLNLVGEYIELNDNLFINDGFNIVRLVFQKGD